MNILHMNTSDTGGAAKAMIRLSQGLRSRGHISQIIVAQQSNHKIETEKLDVQVVPYRGLLDSVLDSVSLSLDLRFGLNAWSYRNSWHLPEIPAFQQADVINLHNLHGGYFNYRALPVLAGVKPLIWTLHDMWALTGHCAYSYGCERWKGGCHDCPLLEEPGRQIVEPAPVAVDRSGAVWRSKREVYRRTPLYVVTPSKWLQGMVEEGILGTATSIQHIPYGVDLDVFCPIDRNIARQALSLPLDKHLIFFSAVGGSDGSAMNPRKGFAELIQALERVPDSQSICLVTSGGSTDLNHYKDRFNIRQLGYLDDERQQCLAFASADLVVFPSLADNLPLVLIEALACGIPIVAFNVGGVPELVAHMETGYLAHYKDPQDLANGIQTLLRDGRLRNRMSQQCRKIAEKEFSIELQVERYLDIYEEAIERNQTMSPIK